MKITKIGHCCLLIEENNRRILTDPGNYSTEQEKLTDIDLILITHEHADHLHVDSLKVVLQNNPQAKVLTNDLVAGILAEAGIEATVLADQEIHALADLKIQAHEAQHAEIHSSLPRYKNTGFMLNDQLFYPGDAFIEPQTKVDILALPVAGPWMRMSEGIDYGLRLKPRVAFPVHDAMLKSPGVHHLLPQKILTEAGIEFVPMLAGETREF